MSYCLNPTCQKPENSGDTQFCNACGTELLLNHRYRAIRLIGQGGFGRTLLAEDEHRPSKPRCVIKQFCRSGQNDVFKASALFEEEAKRLKQLEHPQIPDLYGYFEQSNRQYIIQEFIDGYNLAQELSEQSKPFSEKQIRSLLLDLLPVLQFIHEGGVIHRDIKPENVIRRRSDNKLVLVDFGAAKHATTTALAKTGTVIGSAEYTAPEQARGKAFFASDIYSLGVTCLYLLTQVSPFDLFDITEGTWVWRHYLVDNPVSDELGAILDKMVENLVRDRWRSPAEILTAFTSELQSISTPVLPVARNEISPNISSLISTLQVRSWKYLCTLTGHSKEVYAIVFSPDGQIIASGGSEKVIKLWQLNNASEIFTLNRQHTDWINSLAFSPDGQFLISGSSDNTAKIWQIGNFAEPYTYVDHPAWVTSVAFSPNGNTVATGCRGNLIKLWQANLDKEIYTLQGHTSWVTSVAFSSDGQFLASGSADQTGKLWQVSSGQEITTFMGHSHSLTAVVFAPNGQTLATSGGWDKTIRLWDIVSSQEILRLLGHSELIYAIAFNPDGQTLASCSLDKTIRLWDIESNRQTQIITELARAIAFSPDGKMLAGAGSDGTIKLWHRD